MMKEKIRIGCGAGFSGDRLEPAVILCQRGDIDYLVLECLAERTIALAQKRKLNDPDSGYDLLLERRITELLPLLIEKNICLITNMGAANPIAGAQKILDIANSIGIAVKVAALTGDDVLDHIKEPLANNKLERLENEIPEQALLNPVSANAYLGVEGILQALEHKPNIIITGRVADPSLFLAPMIYEFGWSLDDYDLLGKGTILGHLMECAGHITGGYFADPIKKPVHDLDKLGHPYVDVFPDGNGIISKIERTGGIVNLQTAKEQLLYEVINPNEYLTPDVSANITTVELKEIGTNEILVTGGTGQQKPSTYKVSVGYKAGYIGEGEISFAGEAALERAEMASNIIEKRIKHLYAEFRSDYIGYNAVHRNKSTDVIPNLLSKPSEVRLRIAAKTTDVKLAALVGEEVEALYTNGPAGGGGVRKYINELIGIFSTLIDRNEITPSIQIFNNIITSPNEIV